MKTTVSVRKMHVCPLRFVLYSVVTTFVRMRRSSRVKINVAAKNRRRMGLEAMLRQRHWTSCVRFAGARLAVEAASSS
jgi:hypothetical protein